MPPRVLYIPFPPSPFVEREHAKPWVTVLEKKRDGSSYGLYGDTRAKSLDQATGKRKNLHVLYKGDTFPEDLEKGWLYHRQSKIYVVGHCDRGLHALYARGGSSLQDLLPSRWRPNSVVTYKRLYTQLVSARLPKNFAGKLVIYSCSSAKSTLFHKSFTHLFNKEMREKGFLRCRIFGYRSSVSLGYAVFNDPDNPLKQVLHHGASPRFLGKLRGKEAQNDYWKHRASWQKTKFRPPPKPHHAAKDGAAESDVFAVGSSDDEETEEIATDASTLEDDALEALGNADTESGSASDSSSDSDT